MAGDNEVQNPSTPSENQQYQVSDPLQTTTGNTSIVGQDPSQQPGGVAPTPNGQMPVPNDTQNPQVNQQVQPGQPQQAPAGSTKAPTPPPSRTQRFIDRVREIGDVMGGGDPTITKIDPNTGETTRVRQPQPARAWGIALALEALTGGLAGAGEHGPDAIGKAAQAGVQQGEKISQQMSDRQAQLDQQAQTDLRNRQQVVSNLLQTRQLAQTLGRQSLEQAQESVKADAPSWQAHQDDPTSILGQDMSHDAAYAMLNKLPMGTAQVLITGARPRTDAQTGKPVYQLPNGQVVDQSTPGSYQAPDFTYAVVKPTAKHTITTADNKFTPDVQDAVDYGYMQLGDGADGKLPANYQIDGMAYQAGQRGAQIAKSLNGQINQERASIGLEPIDIKKDVKQDSNVRQGLMVYNQVLSDSNGDHQKAMQAVLNSKYASAAGTIQNWFGGRDAARHLDNMRYSQEFDTDVLNGDHPLVNRDDAQRAMASHNPKVVAAGKAAFSRMDKEDASQAYTKAMATEQAHVTGEKELLEVKDRLSKQGGVNNPNFNEPLDPQSGMKENYLNSLSDGQLVRDVIRGTANVNLRTKAGMALAAEAANATNGRFDSTKYEGYQALRKSLIGKQGDAFSSGSTALDHLNAAYQAANRVSVTPGISALARKGWLGAGARDDAKAFEAARATAAIEIGKAVEGGLLTNQDKEDWEGRVKAWTPAEFKSGAKELANLIYDRMQEKRDQLKQQAPAGIVTGLHGMSQRGVDAYNSITNKGITFADQAIDNNSPQYTQNANPIPAQPPQGTAGTMKFSDGNTYYVDANKKPLAQVQK